MRLIHTTTFELKEFFNNFPPYAILSHTWEDEEVTFQDFQKRWHAVKRGEESTFQDYQNQESAVKKHGYKRVLKGYFNNHQPHASLGASGDGLVISQESQNQEAVVDKLGYRKIEYACQQAADDDLEWCWVDTCCIDKTSSAELSEAINSMFAWYRDAVVCYAYLSDIEVEPYMEGRDARVGCMRNSRWFTRGWTLQELLAPRQLTFYDKGWNVIITKASAFEAGNTTLRYSGISTLYLSGLKPISSASIGERMSWLSSRTTTRVEDLGYCMLGIFNVNMPLLYGEGSRSFVRLQEEIIKQSNDESVFCWWWPEKTVALSWHSVFAPSPACFGGCFMFQSTSPDDAVVRPYQLTNAGLSIWTRLIPSTNANVFLAVLQVVYSNHQETSCIAVRQNPVTGTYARQSLPSEPIAFESFLSMASPYINIHIETRAAQVTKGGTGPAHVDESRTNFVILLLDPYKQLKSEGRVQRKWMQWLSSRNCGYNTEQSLIEFSLNSRMSDHGFVVLRNSEHDDLWYCIEAWNVASKRSYDRAGSRGLIIQQDNESQEDLMYELFDRMIAGPSLSPDESNILPKLRYWHIKHGGNWSKGEQQPGLAMFLTNRDLVSS